MSHAKTPRVEKRGEAETEAGEAEQEAEQLKQVLRVQQEIERLNEEASEKIVEIERHYNLRRQPHYQRRSELIARIPNFWKRVFTNHDLLYGLLEGEDLEVFSHLVDLEVEDFEDVKSGFRIKMRFSPNPYFANDVLCKEFKYSPDGVLQVTPTKILWKPGKNLTESSTGASSKSKKRSTESQSFFLWFDESDQEIDLAEILKEDVWPNPLKYHTAGENGDDDADSGDDGSDENHGAHDDEDELD